MAGAAAWATGLAEVWDCAAQAVILETEILDDLLVHPKQLDSILALDHDLFAFAEEILRLSNDTSGWWRWWGGCLAHATLGSNGIH